MNLPDTVKFLTWLNQHDGRVTVTEPEIEIWSHTLSVIPTDNVKEAALEFYRLHEDTKPSPGAIRKLAYDMRDRAHAKQSALTAKAPTPKNPITYRERNPELWDQEVTRGQQNYRDDLRNRGITPHAEECAYCRT